MQCPGFHPFDAVFPFRTPYAAPSLAANAAAKQCSYPS
jgi:hypothetical protein